MHETLFGNAQLVTGDIHLARHDEKFLQDVITPIYEVMQKVSIFLNAVLVVCFIYIIQLYYF